MTLEQILGLSPADKARLIERIPHLPHEQALKIYHAVEAYKAAKSRQSKQENFLEFVRAMWPAYIHGRHFAIMGNAFERIANGKLKRLMIHMPPRHGKPVDEDTPVLMANGGYLPLRDITIGDQVISHAGWPCLVSAVHVQGRLPCVEIATSSGRKVIAALDHPFLTTDGWVNAGELTPLHTLALVAEPSFDGLSTKRSAEEFRLAGYMIGDGCSAINGTSCQAAFTNFDPETQTDFAYCAAFMGWKTKEKKAGTVTLRGGSYRDADGPRPWLFRSGLARKTAFDKTVPPWVFTAPLPMAAEFIGAYFACDGHVNRRGGKRNDCVVEFYSVSRELLEGVQHLLLRFGIRSRLWTKKGMYKEQKHFSFRLTITSIDDVYLFKNRIPVIGLKSHVLAAWDIHPSTFCADRADHRLPDRVISVEMHGMRPCRCLTVEKDQTFTANDFIVHNSEFVSRLFPAWYLGRFPNRKIIQASSTADLAVGFGRQVRNLVDSEDYQKVFPGVSLARDSKAAGRWNTNRNGEYFAIGAGGSVTGKGGNLLILDDATDEQHALQAESDPTTYEKVFSWYTSGPRQRLQPGGAIVIVATKWAKNDLPGRILQAAINRDLPDEWEVIEFPAILPSGNPLWPEYWPINQLLAIKNELPLHKWLAQFQQTPTSEEGALIKREWWRIWEAGEPPPCEYIIQSWDTAFSKTTRADYSACTTWGVFYQRSETEADEHGRPLKIPAIIALNAFKTKTDFPGLKQRAKLEYTKWQPDTVLVEAKGAGQPLIDELRAVGVPAVAYTPARGNDKFVRINAVSDLFQTGVVWAPPLMWAEEMIEEIAAFPNGEHDDLVDSTTQALIRFRKGGFIPIPSDELDKKGTPLVRADYY